MAMLGKTHGGIQTLFREPREASFYCLRNSVSAAALLDSSPKIVDRNLRLEVFVTTGACAVSRSEHSVAKDWLNSGVHWWQSMAGIGRRLRFVLFPVNINRCKQP